MHWMSATKKAQESYWLFLSTKCQNHPGSKYSLPHALNGHIRTALINHYRHYQQSHMQDMEQLAVEADIRRYLDV